ncbi:hypothetical protein QUA41_30385 [Microcoleus sp. Pol11C1]|uniref:hypothetical protein n=1 Tax=unclassified Microcoleus TaxID=2642155 RepID=UPI002FD50F92
MAAKRSASWNRSRRNPPNHIAPKPPAPYTPWAHKTDAVIDVEATHAPKPPIPIESESSPPKDIEQALKEMPFPLLRTLAKLKGTDARGTKANLAARLKAIVTQSNVRAATT